MAHLSETTLGISTTAYAAGDALGGKLMLTDVPEDGFIQSITVLDKALQNAAMDLVLFSNNFTASSDNATFAVATQDKDNVVAVISVSDYTDLGGSMSVGSVNALAIPYKLASTSRALYGQLVMRSAATYSSSSAITLKLGILGGGGH